MPKTPKKSSVPAPSPKQNWLPLLVAGAVGFAGAFLLLKGCPVTSTVNRLEGCLSQGNLATARECGEKLTRLLEPSMPELAKSAKAIAEAKSLPEARKALAAFQAKMQSSSPMPSSKTP
jgi:hypothetical protein